MNTMHWLLPALAAIVLLSSLRLWRQKLPLRRLATLVLLQVLVAVALYLVLLPPLRPLSAGELTVLGPGAAQVHWQPREGERVVALPEAGTGTAGIERVPDLATALRRHPGTRRMRLIGDGLPARDRDTTLPPGLQIEAPPAPRGWTWLQPPQDGPPGSMFGVHAQAGGVAEARAELLDPAGQVVDRAALDDQGRVLLQGVARTAGSSVFQLRLLDAGRHVVDTVPVPVQTAEATRTRVLLLSAAPGPEPKYLRRWAADAGLDVQAQAGTGAGVTLGDAPVALGTDQLAALDVLVLDERSLASLGATQRRAVRQAIREGLGVLVRTGGPLGDGARQLLRDWGLAVTGTGGLSPLQLADAEEESLLQARRGPRRRVAGSNADVDAADARSHIATAPALQRLALHVGDTRPLLHDAQGAGIGGWRGVGRGRIGLLPVADSYRLVLAGRDDLHAELWSGALAAVARPQPAHDAVRLDSTTAWVDERMRLCDVPPATQVRAPDGSDEPLVIDPASGGQRCAAYWPRQAGWHVLLHDDRQQRFHVFDPAQAPNLHRQQLRDATAILQPATLAGQASAVAATLPGPRWPWLLVFVLVSGLLWWLERRRPAHP